VEKLGQVELDVVMEKLSVNQTIEKTCLMKMTKLMKDHLLSTDWDKTPNHHQVRNLCRLQTFVGRQSK
jgi:hypothetical protein